MINCIAALKKKASSVSRAGVTRSKKAVHDKNKETFKAYTIRITRND